MGDVNQPVAGGDGREEDAQELAERDADRGNGAGLHHQKQCPAVEKAPDRPEGFAEVNVLTAGVGHHRGQFAVGKRAGDRQKAGKQPGAEQQDRRID